MTSFATLLGRLRALARPGNRSPDIEQAWLRVAINGIGFAYVCALISGEGMTVGLAMGLAASSGDAAVGLAILWWLRRSQKYVVPLRYVAIAADNVALTIGMAGAGEAGVAMIGVYLWVTIGNGFRFGPRFLMASYWLALLCFTLQLLFVPFWAQHRMIGIGMLISGAVVPLYVLVLIIRLTAQKDAAEQLSNAKSRFVANVSHELRTPLTGVFAVYDLLQSKKLPPDERELVGMLGAAVKTLKTSVDAVLQMSKLEAGAERAENRLFNLCFFLQQIATVVRPQSVAKRVAWSLLVHPDTPTTVVGDPTHLSHVLGNLLNNAFKFTSSGGVTLAVAPVGTSRVRFEVIDTGIGIPLEQQERLFERFVQVDSSATRRFGGTGLGTSIARDLTELMGGRIGVVSAPGQGSKFWVEIPLPRPDSAPALPSWGAFSQVVLAGSCEVSDRLLVSLQTLGLEVVSTDTWPCKSRTLDHNRLLAVVLAMPAADAVNVLETSTASRELTTPFLFACECTAQQRAVLVASGISGVLGLDFGREAVSVLLAGLVHRLELGHGADAPIVDQSGLVRSLRILLADDNKSNQLLLARILQNAGHSVITADCGAEAFDSMSAGNLDLALLDLNMPDMSGPDIVKLFRAGSAGRARLPIIMLSADATPAAKQQSIDAGADEFVTKPVTAPLLLGAIERVMQGIEARSQAKWIGEASETPSRSAPVMVDPERISSLRRIARGDEIFLAKYLSAAFAEIEKAISDLRQAVGMQDVEAARDAMHIIEGTGSSIGAVALVANCKSARGFVHVRNDPDSAAAIAELSSVYALTKSAVKATIHDYAAHSRTRSTGA